ncbi:MAG: hypothetical protein R2764_05145 [Bacteroidales bacterium]
MHNNKSHIKTFFGFKWITYIYLFLVLVIFAWLINIAIAPLNKSEQIQKLINADSVFTDNFNSTFYNPEMEVLVKEKAYKEALLRLSENDSIQLVVNLSDSTVNLSLRGILIHQTKIATFTKDKFFDKFSLIQEIKLFSQPLLLQSQYATIVKEPIVVRHAPKDTLEAALNAWEPDTLIQNPAFVSLVFEHNIQLILEEDDDENRAFYDEREKFGFYNHLRLEKLKHSASRFFSFKKQEYFPVIKIKMPVDDLRAIYRALPAYTYIVIKL